MFEMAKDGVLYVAELNMLGLIEVTEISIDFIRLETSKYIFFFQIREDFIKTPRQSYRAQNIYDLIKLFLPCSVSGECQVRLFSAALLENTVVQLVAASRWGIGTTTLDVGSSA